MVGQLGDAALAAVGMGGFASFMSMALILGIAVGGAGYCRTTQRPGPL